MFFIHKPSLYTDSDNDENDYKARDSFKRQRLSTSGILQFMYISSTFMVFDILLIINR